MGTFDFQVVNELLERKRSRPSILNNNVTPSLHKITEYVSTPAVDNQVNILSTYSKSVAQLLQCDSTERPTSPDFDYVRAGNFYHPGFLSASGQFRSQLERVVGASPQSIWACSRSVPITARHETHPRRVGMIFVRGYIFEIVRLIVYFYAILMVHLKLRRARADKCRCNESMCQPPPMLATGKQNGDVSFRVYLQRQNAACVPTFAANPLNSPQARHNVNAFMVRDWFPDFVLQLFRAVGRIVFSHDLNLLNRRISLWSGSLENVHSLAGRLYFSTESEAAWR
jgi:hypothetical protein